VDVVREATTSVACEVVVAVEASWNTVIVLVVDQDGSTSSGTPVAQLLVIAGQVVTKVCSK